MELETKYQLDKLNANNVSVIITKYINTEEGLLQVGVPSVCCYSNCPYQREKIQQSLPIEYVNAVFAVWGDKATLLDPERPNIIE